MTSSSRHLQEEVLQARLEDVLGDKKCFIEDLFKTSSTSLQHVFTKMNVCWG